MTTEFLHDPRLIMLQAAWLSECMKTFLFVHKGAQRITAGSKASTSK